MPVSLVQWLGKIGVFYGNFQVFFNSSVCCSVVAPSYPFICHNFCFTKLLTLVLISFFTGFCFHILKKISDNVLMIKSYIRSVTYLLITWNLLEYIWHASRIIMLSGDIETNSGPKHSFSSQGLMICHWNLNSLSSNMYKKVSLLSAYTSIHKFDIICISETYSTPKLHLMIPIWRCMVAILLETITHLTLNVGQSVFIIKRHYLLN